MPFGQESSCVLFISLHGRSLKGNAREGAARKLMKGTCVREKGEYSCKDAMSYMVYCKSSIKPPLSSKPSLSGEES